MTRLRRTVSVLVDFLVTLAAYAAAALFSRSLDDGEVRSAGAQSATTSTWATTRNEQVSGETERTGGATP